MIVLDASVALAWCFTDEASDVADAVADHLRTERALVPAIWPFEVGNGLLSAGRRGRLAASDRPRLTALLAALPIDIEPISLAQNLGPITEIAVARNLSIYDASYLELARRLGLPLATIDDRLRAAASATSVEVFVAA